MKYKMLLKESRAQLVVKELNNGTKIVSEPDQDGYVALEVEIDNRVDILSLYHAGMEAARQMDREWEAAKRGLEELGI
jgi:hypothetical protein